MKKTFALVALVGAMGFVFTACGSAPAGAPPDDIPEFIRTARRDAAMHGFLVGVGTATMANPARSRTVAETRARAELTRQLNSFVEWQMTDHGAGADMDTQTMLEYQAEVQRTVAQGRLVGASILDESLRGNTSWVVVMLSRDNIAAEIASASESAARLVPGAASARVYLADMDRNLARINGEPIVVRDYD